MALSKKALFSSHDLEKSVIPRRTENLPVRACRTPLVAMLWAVSAHQHDTELRKPGEAEAVGNAADR